MFNADTLKALQAPNPDYNISLVDAHKFAAKLAKLGINVTGFLGTLLAPAEGFNSPYPTEAEILAAGSTITFPVPVTSLPLNLQMTVEGVDQKFQVGLTAQDFGQGDYLGVLRVFADIYGPNGQARATSAILGLQHVRDSVRVALN